MCVGVFVDFECMITSVSQCRDWPVRSHACSGEATGSNNNMSVNLCTRMLSPVLCVFPHVLVVLSPFSVRMYGQKPGALNPRPAPPRQQLMFKLLMR